MVKVHKRTKNSRIRGARTCGWGFRQKHKGHGNKGGFGMAGTGKRGDHKKQSAAMSVKGKYFGKQGATSRGTQKDKSEKINLKDIKSNFFKKDGDKINFSKHKILGTGDGFKAEITALSASAGAIAKMEKAGGKIILPAKKGPAKQYVVKEPSIQGTSGEAKKVEAKEEVSDDKE
ncbi:MAG: uL15 family ribosomal protein [Nanoarchaeota archaeon]|nr:uL15 family ribosomal protein [Nanoarchaeota archaeon]